MNPHVPRLRMFAGPNGSGKSTIKQLVRQEMLGIYINPDEIEKNLRHEGFLELRDFDITTSAEEIQDFFTQSSLLKNAGLLNDVVHIHFQNGKLMFSGVRINSYFASVAADFIRRKLLAEKKSFTFETVMSSPDKVEILRKAQENGYRTYLYYVATEDPEINISRIDYRVSVGGHSVPKDKIVSRYQRSLDLLVEATGYANRAFIFDNSTHEQIWLAEITDGTKLDMKTTILPNWFKNALLYKFSPPKNS
jgi:predicted ABC-type ATPase